MCIRDRNNCEACAQRQQLCASSMQPARRSRTHQREQTVVRSARTSTVAMSSIANTVTTSVSSKSSAVMMPCLLYTADGLVLQQTTFSDENARCKLQFFSLQTKSIRTVNDFKYSDRSYVISHEKAYSFSCLLYTYSRVFFSVKITHS